MADRPHILVVMVDQLAASFLRAYGHPVTKTPTFDRLADGSVVFENAYSPSPLCAPARAAFMTGALPSRTAVYDNAAELRSSIPTFAHYLRLEGYRTCLCGKMHFVGADQLHGFEERLTTDVYPGDFGWTPDWSKPDDRIDWWFHNTSSITQAGVADITNALEYDDEVAFHAVRRVYDYARYDGEAPLLLCVSFSHPHDPYVARQRYWDLYDDDEIDLPVAPGPPDAALDPHSRRLWEASAMDAVELTADDVRRARHGYYAALSYVDERVGEVVAAFEACGLLEDTVVVLTSDHGDFLGEFGLFFKMSFREHAARVPLIVHAPSRFSARRVREPVSLVDVLPTLADLARPGLSGALAHDGRRPHPRTAPRGRSGGSRGDCSGRVPGRVRPGADGHDQARAVEVRPHAGRSGSALRSRRGPARALQPRRGRRQGGRRGRLPRGDPKAVGPRGARARRPGEPACSLDRL